MRGFAPLSARLTKANLRFLRDPSSVVPSHDTFSRKWRRITYPDRQMTRNFVLIALAATALAACSKAEQTTDTAPAATPVELTDVQKAALAAELPAPYNTGDIANGKSVFLICKSCHTLVEGGASMTGPNLWGVFGRKAASVAGFNYSDPMKASAITWDAATMDKWITDPKELILGTKMSFVGIKSPKDRIDVIAYLKSETSPAK